MNTNTLGRTRLSRLAAVTVPATVLSLGLGMAVLQGSVGAIFASSDAFSLTSTSLSAEDLAMRPGFAGPGTAAGSKSSAVAAVDVATANDLGMHVTKAIPLVGDVSVRFCLGGSNFNLGSTLLNAGDLEASGAGTQIGGAIVVGAQQTGASTVAGWNDADTGYDAPGFALTANGNATNKTVLNNLNAHAYRADLPGGLNGISSIKILTAKGTSAPVCSTVITPAP